MDKDYQIKELTSQVEDFSEYASDLEAENRFLHQTNVDLEDKITKQRTAYNKLNKRYIELIKRLS